MKLFISLNEKSPHLCYIFPSLSYFPLSHASVKISIKPACLLASTSHHFDTKVLIQTNASFEDNLWIFAALPSCSSNSCKNGTENKDFTEVWNYTVSIPCTTHIHSKTWTIISLFLQRSLIGLCYSNGHDLIQYISLFTSSFHVSQKKWLKWQTEDSKPTLSLRRLKV